MRRAGIALLVMIVVTVICWAACYIGDYLPSQHVYGKLRIRTRGIYADVYIRDHDQDCDCTTPLWHGGRVTVKEDLSAVQLYDMAELTSLTGEHYVLELVSVTGIPAWMQKVDGDVLVVNGLYVYRFIRL